MIEMQHISKVFKENSIALSDITLKIDKGEFVFLVGPSGAGKSTFIKLLLKEIEPTSGIITVNNINLSTLKHRQIPYYRRTIGTVFQDFRLLPNLTAYENIAFAMHIVEASSRDIRRRVAQVLAMVDLSRKANSYPNQLSGGEQQRVALARALVNNPSILIADEPTGNLDPDSAWTILDILDDVNKVGTTVVMATHAKDIVNKAKKRVIALEKGVLVRDQKRGAYNYED
ncbi:MAG: cell division ATP-binding protein FtsE [Clostridiales bacterium]|nr:cell division ATP-binding protein FtsE [Clostridiales bacterium]HBM79558.1 cell division ATP-binding protein FtsE [Clostridiaceae bacterium]